MGEWMHCAFRQCAVGKQKPCLIAYLRAPVSVAVVRNHKVGKWILGSLLRFLLVFPLPPQLGFTHDGSSESSKPSSKNLLLDEEWSGRKKARVASRYLLKSSERYKQNH